MKVVFLCVLFAVTVMEQTQFPQITLSSKTHNTVDKSPQLKRIGGNAPITDELKSLQCSPKRYNGGNITWHCTCCITCNLQLELINITCETYNIDFILTDTCRAEYNLNYEPSCAPFIFAKEVKIIQNNDGSFSHVHENISLESLFLIISLILMLVSLLIMPRRKNS